MKIFALVVLYCFAAPPVDSLDLQCRNSTINEQFIDRDMCLARGNLYIDNVHAIRPVGFREVVCPEFWQHDPTAE